MKNGFIQILLVIIVIAISSFGAGYILHKTGKLTPIEAGISNIFRNIKLSSLKTEEQTPAAAQQSQPQEQTSRVSFSSTPSPSSTLAPMSKPKVTTSYNPIPSPTPAPTFAIPSGETDAQKKKRIDDMRVGLKNVVTYYQNLEKDSIRETTTIVVNYYDSLISANQKEQASLKSYQLEIQGYAFLVPEVSMDNVFVQYFNVSDAETTLLVAKKNQWQYVQDKVLKDIDNTASSLIDYINSLSDTKLETDYSAITKEIGTGFGDIPVSYLAAIKQDTDDYIKNNLSKRQDTTSSFYNVANLWLEKAKSRINQLIDDNQHLTNPSSASEYKYNQYLVDTNSIAFQLQGLNQQFSNFSRIVESFNMRPY